MKCGSITVVGSYAVFFNGNILIQESKLSDNSYKCINY